MSNKTIRIEQDHSPESPRDWDNLGTMVCWHGRYTLGDEQPECDPQEYMLHMAEEFEPGIEDKVERYAERLWAKLDQRGGISLEGKLKSHAQDVSEYQRDKVEEILDRHVVMLPLYLYDHGGITMNTKGFHCPWDSGQVGFIYVSKQQLRDEYDWKLITEKRCRKVGDILRGEVETYDQFLTGDVYGYVIEDEDGEKEGRCWGFYGSDPFQNGMSDDIPEELHDQLKEAAE